MKPFHELLYNFHSTDLERIEDYDVGDFNLTELWDGKRIATGIPDSVVLYMSQWGKPADYLFNPLSWPIVSERLLGIIWTLVEPDVQILDVTIVRESDKRKVPGYKLMNITQRINCLDHQQSTILKEDDGSIRSIPEICVKSDRVGEHHIFRLDEYPHIILVSDEWAQSLVGKRIRGLAFERCNVS